MCGGSAARRPRRPHCGRPLHTPLAQAARSRRGERAQPHVAAAAAVGKQCEVAPPPSRHGEPRSTFGRAATPPSGQIAPGGAKIEVHRAAGPQRRDGR